MVYFLFIASLCSDIYPITNLMPKIKWADFFLSIIDLLHKYANSFAGLKKKS